MDSRGSGNVLIGGAEENNIPISWFLGRGFNLKPPEYQMSV
jgi:hypothetical protein